MNRGGFRLAPFEFLKPCGLWAAGFFIFRSGERPIFANRI
jgi:hypothetical protein